MAYDSRIILAGQGPDILGAVNAGDTAAATTNALRTNNRLAELYRTQGAGILSGDQNALNALAGIDPNAALGIQGTQLGMEATRLNMSMAQEEMQMKRDAIRAEAERAAAAMTAEQRAAEAAKIESGIKAASTAQTPEQWDAIVTQFGVPDLAGQFGMKDALLTQYAEVADILKGGGAVDVSDRYRNVGDRLIDLGAEGGPADVTPEIPGGAANTIDTKAESDFRKEFNGIPAVKEYAVQTDAMGRISASARDPSAAGDMSLLYAYMKMLDPGSVVRESEFATAAQSGSLGEQMQGWVGKILSGQRLTPDQRADFVARSQMLYDQASRNYEAFKGQYGKIAESYGFDVDRVLVPYTLQEMQQPETGVAPVGQDATPAQDGWTDLGGGVMIREVP